jgi:hypothetical protein
VCSSRQLAARTNAVELEKLQLDVTVLKPHEPYALCTVHTAGAHRASHTRLHRAGSRANGTTVDALVVLLLFRAHSRVVSQSFAVRGVALIGASWNAARCTDVCVRTFMCVVRSRSERIEASGSITNLLVRECARAWWWCALFNLISLSSSPICC